MSDAVARDLDLGPRYRVIKLVGRGAAAAVYQAYDVELQREIALKVLHDDRLMDEAGFERFRREVALASQITSKHVLRVYDLGHSGNKRFLSMQFVDGEDLATLLRRERPLPVERAVALFRQMCDGVAAAHEQGIVHRDLKPRNVLVDQSDNVYVADFGIARAVEGPSMTATGQILGSPAYMSPEQVKGEGADVRSDIYALGVILYELLAGSPPFAGVSVLAVMHQRLHRPPPPLREACASVPAYLEAIVERCLAMKPEDRFPTCRELLAELDAAPMRTGSTRKSAAWRVRGVVAAAGVLALGALVWVTISRVRATEKLSSASPPSASVSATPAEPRVTTLTDLALPPSSIPEARTEYAAGMQLMRDDNWLVAQDHFRRAAELDPSMALAHLRVALTNLGNSDNAERRRAEFAQTVALRAQLDARDQALLEAFEPMLGRARDDPHEALARLEKVSESYPLDVELLDWVATLAAAEPARGEAAARRVNELDPKDGNGWECLGRALAHEGEADESARAFERCASISPQARDCIQWLSRLAMLRGQCEEAERYAQRTADFAPTRGTVEAMVALHRPEPAIREMLMRWTARQPEAEQPAWRAIAEVRLALQKGHFDAASRFLGDVATALAAAPTLRADYRFNYDVWRTRVGIGLETGDEQAARAAARAFAAVDEQWTMGQLLNGGVDAKLWLDRLASGTELGADPRAAWIEERIRAGASPGLVWTYGWAAPALTPAEAKTAVEALAADPRLATPREGEALELVEREIPEAWAGRAYLLADYPSEAVPLLRRAAANCNVYTYPFTSVHAALDLGSALEKMDQVQDACRAYAKVVASWGEATPRSVSAETARKRMKALNCR